MLMTTERDGRERPFPPETDRAAGEMRKGFRLLEVSAVVLVTTMLVWLLVARANGDGGDHHGNALPLLALIPLALALYHLARTRTRHR
jgi:hypothetical protein